jgi:hypothetical protein
VARCDLNDRRVRRHLETVVFQHRSNGAFDARVLTGKLLRDLPDIRRHGRSGLAGDRPPLDLETTTRRIRTGAAATLEHGRVQ